MGRPLRLINIYEFTDAVIIYFTHVRTKIHDAHCIYNVCQSRQFGSAKYRSQHVCTRASTVTNQRSTAVQSRVVSGTRLHILLSVYRHRFIKSTQGSSLTRTHTPPTRALAYSSCVLQDSSRSRGRVHRGLLLTETDTVTF